MSFDEFADQESAGGFSDFDFEVTNAYFAIDAKYSEATGADTHFLVWEGISGIEGYEQMTRDGFHPKWACDPDFVSIDGGKTIVSQSGKSRIGKAAARMMTAAAAALVEAGLKESPENPFNAPGVTPRTASAWVGTRWHLKEVEREFGNGMKSRDLLPVQYLGKGDGTGPVAAPAAAAPVAAAAPAAAPVAAAPNVDLRSQVVGLATTVADHSQFVAAAMSIPGVTGDSALVADIVNPNGIYATKA